MLLALIQKFAAGMPHADPLLRQLIDAWHAWTRNLFDPYRPELHYMRGRGPKWFEKHAGMAPAPARVAARRRQGS